MASSRFWIAAFVVFGGYARFAAAATTLPSGCSTAVAGTAVPSALAPFPPEIDPGKTFDALVQWTYDEIVVRSNAPGLVIGLSGTDSILAFLVAAKAYERAGRGDRVAGVHFGPSEDFLDDHPEAAAHLWFQEQLVPWLEKKAPQAKIFVDTSIDWRLDGLRWGALMEWAVTSDRQTRAQRPRDQRYWVVGTRNATEDALFTYSNASMPVSVQPLLHLWKSDILRISKWLGVPEIAIDKSCDVDCVCGRTQRLPALHAPEVDAILMTRAGLLAPSYIERTIPPLLRQQLVAYVEEQIAGASFKAEIPYVPTVATVVSDDAKLASLEDVRRRLAEGVRKEGDARMLARWVPVLVAEGRANVAAELVTLASPNREAWLPEALALFRTAGIREPALRQMLAAVFAGGIPKSFGAPDVRALARTAGRVGTLGFRFPQWRFLAQSIGTGPALAERFHLERLVRENDLRDATLPSGDPGRDQLGTGFVRRAADSYLEWRRSYVVSALGGPAPVVVVKRNDSHFFGRDRLPAAAYVSFEPWTPAELENIDRGKLEHSGKFHRFTDVLALTGLPPDRLDRIDRAVDAIDGLDREVDRWLRTAAGALALADLLDAKAKAGLYLGLVPADEPSWRPTAPVLATTVEFRQALRERGPAALPVSGPGQRLVLMSGARGDLP